VKCSELLVVGELVRVQQALIEGRTRMMLWRTLHKIQNEADGLLGHGQDQVIITILLPADAAKTKLALGQHKPVVHPKGR
jgi:hypothetical protein